MSRRGNANVSGPQAERQALKLSLFGGLAFAIAGISIGALTESQLILFDGFYAFVGVGLSWMALKAAGLVHAGPTATFPFGREGLAPLVIGFEGVALLATCGYASIDAVLTIRGGGGQVAGGWALAYAAASLIVPWVVASRLQKIEGSELVDAEATQWMAGAALGLGMVVAFASALLLASTAWSNIAVYIDPAMVLVASAVFAIPPLRMIRLTWVELLEGAPSDQVQAPVHSALNEVRRQFNLDEPRVRMAKVGPKLYIELDFVVEAGTSVGQTDQVRHELVRQFKDLPFDLWVTAEFSSDAAWGE